jgi:hexosaminidase
MCDGSLGIGCTIDWGEGTATTTGNVTGVNATDTQVNSLYTISGAHTYPKPGTYHGTVALSAGNAPSITADFTAVVP